jgi:hypothetical protein
MDNSSASSWSKMLVSAVTETDGRVDAPVAVLRWTVLAFIACENGNGLHRNMVSVEQSVVVLEDTESEVVLITALDFRV